MRFGSVYVREECGIADATGFHLFETHRYSTSGFPFSACRIDGRQIAVFAEMTVPPADRPELTSRKPDWLDAIIYARVVSDPRADVAVLEAKVSNVDDAELNLFVGQPKECRWCQSPLKKGALVCTACELPQGKVYHPTPRLLGALLTIAAFPFAAWSYEHWDSRSDNMRKALERKMAENEAVLQLTYD